MDKYYLGALHMVPGIGGASIQKLINFFGSAQEAWWAKKEELISSRLLNETVCNNFITHREKIDVQKAMEEWGKKGIKLCTLYDSGYPSLLRNIYNPPIILYYRGILPSAVETIAIVGSRRATPYGKNAACLLAKELAANGFWVVSGGARGIDTAAHLGALSQGNTIAVMGCGVDFIYPPENKKMFERIAEAGTIVSEYPPGTAPRAAFFPARNRMISGLSRGTVIVEAAIKSGALITADFALEQGRDVFAVPGSIFSALSKGTNQLIRQGAKLVENVKDILEEYSVTTDEPKSCETILSGDEHSIYAILTYDMPLGIEEIVMKTNLTPSTVTYILLQLELRGLVAGQSGQRYVRLSGRESGE